MYVYKMQARISRLLRISQLLHVSVNRTCPRALPFHQVHTVEGGDHGLAVPKSLLRAAAAAAAATAAAATATADTATATATAIGSGRVGKGKRAGARQEPKQGTTVQGSGSAGQVAMALEAGGSDGGKSGAEGTATPVDAAIRAVVGWLAEQCSGCAAGASV